MTSLKGYTFCYYVSGHGFGHATRVNQIITELLKRCSVPLDEPSSSPAMAAVTPQEPGSNRHTIYIASDAPQFIFQDVIALGAIYRNAKVDAGVVQPLAYSVDRQQTIEGVKSFLSRRDEMIRNEVAWLAQVGADCVLVDAPFLPCAAAHAYGIPACLITNFTFDEVYRFLREGDPMDRDVMACADAALEDYKKASLLLRLPGSIDIPAFEDEIQALESTRLLSDTPADANAMKNVDVGQNGVQQTNSNATALTAQFAALMSKTGGLKRRAIDVPMVVRKSIHSREEVLRSLGVDEETIATKRVVLVSFGGQRLKQGWGNPLPEGWIGIICGLPVSHELPDGFYRSPHGVYVPDLTNAADIVIGKLGYGTCSECIAHDKPLIYVSRPQFVEEHGLIKMMVKHGLPVEMTSEEFEMGLWQRSILVADRQAQEEKENRARSLKYSNGNGRQSTLEPPSQQQHPRSIKNMPLSIRTSTSSLMPPGFTSATLAESVNRGELARGGPISPIEELFQPEHLLQRSRSRRSGSIVSLTTILSKGSRATPLTASVDGRDGRESGFNLEARRPLTAGIGGPLSPGMATAIFMARQGASPMDLHSTVSRAIDMDMDMDMVTLQGGTMKEEEEEEEEATLLQRRIPDNGGEVCASLLEEFMLQWNRIRSEK